MSEERRKINKHSTGTVPKTKYRNNTSYGSLNDHDAGQSVTNNFVSSEISERKVVQCNFLHCAVEKLIGR